MDGYLIYIYLIKKKTKIIVETFGVQVNTQSEAKFEKNRWKCLNALNSMLELQCPVDDLLHARDNYRLMFFVIEKIEKHTFVPRMFMAQMCTTEVQKEKALLQVYRYRKLTSKFPKIVALQMTCRTKRKRRRNYSINTSFDRSTTYDFFCLKRCQDQTVMIRRRAMQINFAIFLLSAVLDDRTFLDHIVPNDKLDGEHLRHGHQLWLSCPIVNVVAQVVDTQVLQEHGMRGRYDGPNELVEIQFFTCTPRILRILVVKYQKAAIRARTVTLNVNDTLAFRLV